jgi:hypothetical protein
MLHGFLAFELDCKRINICVDVSHPEVGIPVLHGDLPGEWG